jgi:phytoene desaturase
MAMNQKATNLPNNRKIGIVGAGPGGLTSAMLLAHQGFDVTVLEMANEVGGRSAPIHLDGFTFDTGPTFLMMKYVLDEVFESCDRKSTDYLKFKLLDPMYHLNFEDLTMQISSDKEKMSAEINKHFPGNETGLDKFYSKEGKRYEKIIQNLYRDYSSITSFLSPKLLGALPSFFARGSIFDNLGNYFKEEKLRVCFTFQSKYLGMSPWECPASFTMIPYVEHQFGIYHVMGGLNQIPKAMAKVVEEENGAVITGKTVEKIITSGKKVTGVQLDDGERMNFDKVIVNADFGYAMTNLFEPNDVRKYSPEKLEKKKFSCSTFMLYLGVDKIYSAPHHSIFFAKNYRQNIEEIGEGRLSDDFSFYVQNASVTDESLAPTGKSAVYILVPVPNNRSNINWDIKEKDYKEKVLDKVEERSQMNDIRDHIEVEKTIAPKDWEKDYNVYIGATFNLAHNLSQMLYFRPHNRCGELKNLYLVGGGTHPGSGLPTIYISGIVTAGLISKNS